AAAIVDAAAGGTGGVETQSGARDRQCAGVVDAAANAVGLAVTGSGCAGGILAQGAAADRQRALVVDAAAGGRGVVGPDEAAAERQHAEVENAAAVVAGAAGDRQAAQRGARTGTIHLDHPGGVACVDRQLTGARALDRQVLVDLQLGAEGNGLTV